MPNMLQSENIFTAQMQMGICKQVFMCHERLPLKEDPAENILTPARQPKAAEVSQYKCKLWDIFYTV